jgi:hypothetical protein
MILESLCLILTVLVYTNLFLLSIFCAEKKILYIIHLPAMYRNKAKSWRLTNICRDLNAMLCTWLPFAAYLFWSIMETSDEIDICLNKNI